MEKDSEGRQEQPSAPGLKVTDCFPSETFESLSFLSRPGAVAEGGGTNAMRKISKWAIIIFGTSFAVSQRREKHRRLWFHLTFIWNRSAILMSSTEDSVADLNVDLIITCMDLNRAVKLATYLQMILEVSLS